MLADNDQDVVLVSREDVVEHFNDCHVHPELRKHRRELYPHISRANDDEFVRPMSVPSTSRDDHPDVDVSNVD